jgi:bacterial/archaeal transporter family-2 protein
MRRSSSGFLLIGELLLAASAGIATAFQPGINAQIAAHTPSRFYGGIANFAVGLLTMLLVCAFLRPPLPDIHRLSQAPWWAWTGGLLGAFFVCMALSLVPRMGASTYLAAMIAGQLIAGLVIDHYGLVGLIPREISPGRIAGVLLVVAGVACIRWL